MKILLLQCSHVVECQSFSLYRLFIGEQYQRDILLAFLRILQLYINQKTSTDLVFVYVLTMTLALPHFLYISLSLSFLPLFPFALSNTKLFCYSNSTIDIGSLLSLFLHLYLCAKCTTIHFSALTCLHCVDRTHPKLFTEELSSNRFCVSSVRF